MVLKDKDAYAQKYLNWWATLNPSWRKRVDGKVVGRGSGDWSSLYNPGPNGFLNVIAGLVALRQVVTTSEWAQVLGDVQWVVHEVLDAKKSAKYIAYYHGNIGTDLSQ